MNSSPSPNPFYINLFFLITLLILTEYFPMVINDYPFLFIFAMLNAIVFPLLLICHVTGDWS